jgi:hypothetical protein
MGLAVERLARTTAKYAAGIASDIANDLLVAKWRVESRDIPQNMNVIACNDSALKVKPGLSSPRL